MSYRPYTSAALVVRTSKIRGRSRKFDVESKFSGKIRNKEIVTGRARPQIVEIPSSKFGSTKTTVDDC